MFTGFLHNIQTSGAAGSGWHSWGREDTSRTIRQLGNSSRKGMSPNAVSGPVTVASAPTQTQQLPHAPGCPHWAFLGFLFLSDAVFFSPLLFMISLKKPVFTIRGTVCPITVSYLCANFSKARAAPSEKKTIIIVKHMIYACATYGCFRSYLRSTNTKSLTHPGCASPHRFLLPLRTRRYKLWCFRGFLWACAAPGKRRDHRMKNGEKQSRGAAFSSVTQMGY